MGRLVKAASGIAYAVLVVVGVLLLVQEEIDSDTNKEILNFYADSGNRGAQIAGFALVTVGVLFFLWFVSILRARLDAAAPEPRSLAFLAFGAGTTAAALLVGGAASLAATSFAVELSDDFIVDPDLARFAVGAGYLMLAGAVLVSCVLVASTSVVALRSDVLPNWLGWVGFAAIVLAVVETFLLPVFVIPLWVVIVSVVWIARSASREVVQDAEPPSQTLST